MICCCKRKPNGNFQMLNTQRNVHNETKFLSDIYDHILSPCDNTDIIPETPPKQIMKPRRKSNVYVNFFEQNDFECITPTFECITPTYDCSTPRMYQDTHGNMIHIKIPKNSDLYVNYEKFNNFN
jgi:hypothetical protein